MPRSFDYNDFIDFITLSTLKLIIVLRIVYCACGCALGVLCLGAFCESYNQIKKGEVKMNDMVNVFLEILFKPSSPLCILEVIL